MKYKQFTILITILLPWTAFALNCSYSFQQNFGYGAIDQNTSGEVSKLQQFLGLAQTGGFGTRTALTLWQFQLGNGIISGKQRYRASKVSFGPSTRQTIARLCAATVPPTSSFVPVINTNSCPQQNIIACPADQVAVSLGTDAQGCSLGSRCTARGVTETNASCPIYNTIPCPVGQAPVSIGTDANGCARPPRCEETITSTTTSQSVSLNSLVNADPSPRTITISTPLAVTGSLTVPGDITLNIVPGGSIVAINATNLTINGQLNADPAPIFVNFTPGQIKFASNHALVRPEWWGMSPYAVASMNTTALQSAVLSALGGGTVQLGAGLFVVAGVGTPSNLNGAAIEINKQNNPSGAPLTIQGAGEGKTFLSLAANNPFNIMEIVNAVDNTQTPMPITIQDLSFDGNSDHQQQQAAGDRYQNDLYLMNVSGVRVSNVELYGASYHGFHANALANGDIAVSVHGNTGDGVVLTGNERDGIYGTDSHYHIVADNNGIPRLSNYDMPMDANGNRPSPCDSTRHLCDVDTYHGIYVALQRGITLDATTTNQRYNQGVELGRIENSTITLYSNQDSQGGLALDGGVINNTIAAKVTNGGTALRDLGNGGDVNNTAGVVRGNKIALTAITDGQVANLGTGRGIFDSNTLSGSFLNLMKPAQGALIVVGSNFKNNIVTDFTAGDQQGAGNVGFIVQAYPGTGGGNTIKNGTIVGTVTSIKFAGLGATDTIQ